MISVSSLLAIASIHELPIRSIDFVLAFTQYDLDVDILMDLPLVMAVDRNRVKWVIKLNKPLYGFNQKSANWFNILKMV